LLFRHELNPSYETEGPKITIEGENANVILDGTVSAKANWEPYSLNGHSIYKAELDMHDISYQAGIKVDSIYGVWVDDRFMIPAMPVNFKNPTDPTTGNPDNPEPGSIWSIDYTAPYEYHLGQCLFTILVSWQIWILSKSGHSTRKQIHYIFIQAIICPILQMFECA